MPPSNCFIRLILDYAVYAPSGVIRAGTRVRSSFLESNGNQVQTSTKDWKR